MAEIGIKRRDGDWYVFLRIAGQPDQETGPFETRDAAQSAADDLTAMFSVIRTPQRHALGRRIVKLR